MGPSKMYLLLEHGDIPASYVRLPEANTPISESLKIWGRGAANRVTACGLLGVVGGWTLRKFEWNEISRPWLAMMCFSFYVSNILHLSFSWLIDWAFNIGIGRIEWSQRWKGRPTVPFVTTIELGLECAGILSELVWTLESYMMGSWSQHRNP